MMKKRPSVPFWRNPRVRYGSLSTLLVCLVLAALILLNLAMTTLEKKHGWRMDYSFNALTTHSETTLQVLSQLEHPVHIYALYTRGNEDAPLMELLDRYAAASPLITWEQTDVALNPGLLTRFQGVTSDDVVSNDSLIVFCEETGRWKILSPVDFISLSLDYTSGSYALSGVTYESKITSAISYVTQEQIPRVLMLQGHGELDEETSGILAELLRSNNFDVQYGTLASFDLQPGDLLALLSPIRDLSDSDLATITAFTAQGGSLLLTCDYGDPIEKMPNYAALLRSYGFLPLNGIVVASSSEPESYYNNQRIYLIPTMLYADTTRDLMLNSTSVLLLAGSRAFETPESTDSSLLVSPTLTSGEQSYLRVFSNNSVSLDKQEGDLMGPFSLALEAQRITGEGYVSRAVVLGCSTLLTNAQIHAITDAEEFIIRTVEFLVDAKPSDLGIMAKTAIRPGLSAASSMLGSFMLVLLPVSVLGAALIVLWPRRHR